METRLRMMRAPMQIRRFRGIDNNGILFFGCTKHINQRRKQLIRASEGRHGHSEGLHWFLVVKHWKGKPESMLIYEYIKTEIKEKALEIEKDEIHRYFL